MNSNHRVSWQAWGLLLPLLLSAFACTAETGSSHNLFILKGLDNDWTFVGRANLATREGLSDTFFGYVDANLRYDLNDNWSVEAGYRQAWLDIASEWREEYRPMFGLIWRGKWGSWKFTNRHRLELRYFEGNAEDLQRYRNETIWTSPRSYTDLNLTPYINEEFFYDLTDDEFTVNWLTFGVSKKLADGFKWKLGYRLQSQLFNDEWTDRHVLVTGISYIDL